MLIVAVLGGVLFLVVLAAIRFARMDPARERGVAEARERRRTVFAGVVTARAARETLPELLLHDYAGERVKVTVERLGGRAAGEAGPA